ncbi:MAG: 50S ribosomal protein L9 [Candidatus Doudnabacteria bacterium RIFCSPHIGHO2_02_FULL_48_21]|uniref:Large ribosomal subunit protein bL9 n=1 Tax=Candidatus Doudnabacteria bacterium RIFCSPLOWO2_02_FULL_48_13 TaxID=1817845 RepID=A0A1F5QAG8_9BACT|nr:MAG: 50S ribosomal protein L9 [Candidatus Doudnabacteria bacterium RIFCSPHIGHO2_01_48_18]OGE78859.1 MAG: 50S ribosomal protein L9 [Candidatus Doudnabacteria bacterium RIFCSPHIGHO2_01_FULL_48_180]OGE91850.1 MAG: 50S ribosomal protein L9 [Candidatus Doudnabacteria bacterium RIFCSPHIGHO2_12_FULL_47_25]OGE94087.1 MAG: 50S ribosomal protein L9 [Candidatus Doudnabacteria bacterium RIFCSPHIGHO2_02_FULL_48_21]OGE98207.1 MAG: 50S ribosomal protein L9 [Candidatus Doudnabacteria bacterium RIFCSPLOWO2_0
MRIILLKDVKKIGRQGDVKEVSDGYARNFLLPAGLGKPATEELVRAAQDKDRKSGEEAKRRLKALETAAKRIYEFQLPAGKNGHLYAGLKKSEILAKIEQGDATLKNLRLDEYSPIKNAGEHEITLEIHSVGKAKTKVIVTASK